MGYFDPTYLLVLLGAVVCMIASAKVKSTYQKYSRVGTASGMTSQEVAMRMLHEAGIYDVQIQRINGELTDHYSPKEKVLRLSDTVYGSTSVAAIGVAAHECGHALQHQQEYGPLKLRSVAVPMANFGSYLSWPIILLGLFLGYMNLAKIGVLLFCFVVFFQLITLPVELDASRRAMQVLTGQGILVGQEVDGARKVLQAAALTYVAALFSAILQLIRLILLTQGGDRRDRRR